MMLQARYMLILVNEKALKKCLSSGNLILRSLANHKQSMLIVMQHIKLMLLRIGGEKKNLRVLR